MYPYPRRYSHNAVIKIAAVQPKQVMPIQKFLVFFIGYCTSSSLQWFGGGAGIAGKSQRNRQTAGNKPTILPLLRLQAIPSKQVVKFLLCNPPRVADVVRNKGYFPMTFAIATLW